MNDKNLSKALDDVKFIKDIINQTGKSLSSIGEVFLKWGVLFLIHAGLYLGLAKLYSNNNLTYKNTIISSILLLLITSIIAVLIYSKVSKNEKTVALEKKLLVIWFCIIAFTLIYSNLYGNIVINKPAAVIGSPGGPTATVYSINTNLSFATIDPIYILFYAFGLFVTSVFTNFKQPKYIALLYVIIALMYPFITIKELSLLIAPLTFLYLGIYLKTKSSKEL